MPFSRNAFLTIIRHGKIPPHKAPLKDLKIRLASSPKSEASSANESDNNKLYRIVAIIQCYSFTWLTCAVYVTLATVLCLRYGVLLSSAAFVIKTKVRHFSIDIFSTGCDPITCTHLSHASYYPAHR